MSDWKRRLKDLRQRTDPIASFLSDYSTAAKFLLGVVAFLCAAGLVFLRSFGLAWFLVLLLLFVTVALAIAVVVLARRERPSDAAPATATSEATLSAAARPKTNDPSPAGVEVPTRPAPRTSRNHPLRAQRPPHEVMLNGDLVDRLQGLFNQGMGLKERYVPMGRPTSIAMRMNMPGPPTTESDVRLWSAQVEVALRGKPRQLYRFQSQPASPPFQVAFFEDPVRRQLDHKLDVLEGVIEELGDS